MRRTKISYNVTGYTATDKEVHIHFNKSDVFKYCVKQKSTWLDFMMTVLVALSSGSVPIALFCGLVFIRYCFDSYMKYRMIELLFTVQKVAPNSMKQAIEAFDKEEA